ncbi:hypothetical protein D3C87_989040 [compost metagenome]
MLRRPALETYSSPERSRTIRASEYPEQSRSNSGALTASRRPDTVITVVSACW